jgi:hypothetical protein
MSAQLCHFCGGDPMLQKITFPLIAEKIPTAGSPRIAIYQCEQCKRIEARTETLGA